jgi:hypothetical protein
VEEQMRELVEFWLARLQEKAAEATDPAEWELLVPEIEADRRLFRQYEDAVRGGGDPGELAGLEYAIRCRVAVRADHPDYRDEWAPADVPAAT